MDACLVVEIADVTNDLQRADHFRAVLVPFLDGPAQGGHQSKLVEDDRTKASAHVADGMMELVADRGDRDSTLTRIVAARPLTDRYRKRLDRADRLTQLV